MASPLATTPTAAVHHRCITRAAFGGVYNKPTKPKLAMVEPGDVKLAKNPAYRPATEKALETGLFYACDSPATRQARPAAG
jgi:hypothetical protein